MKSWLAAAFWLCLGVLLGGAGTWYWRGQEETAALSASIPATTSSQSVNDSTDADAGLVREGRFADLAPGYKHNLDDYLTLLDGLPARTRQSAIDAWVDANGESFGSLMAKSAIQGELGACSRQVDLLISAAQVVRTGAQQHAMESALSDATDACARHLLSEQRYDDVDHMYEQVTLALPELADYFLKLGQFRIRTGNFDGALAVLAQIENHGDLGAEARKLMRQVEASEAIAAAGSESLPLVAHGSQFLVNASIDGGPAVPLLIDTGAAMTVIDAGLLRRLGYPLDGKRAWFATAGGAVSAPVVSLHRFALGHAAIDELTVGALTMDLGDQVQGLLGMNFLRHFNFHIDQQSHVLHLDKRG